MEIESVISLYKTKSISADVCVVGGGMAGVCAAVAAARNGAKTVLIQDRPVLGGNASSEVRMHICGARGADSKEGGLLEEILLDNYYYNSAMNYTVWDGVLFGFCRQEPNLTLVLNCAVDSVECVNGHISRVSGWHLTEQCFYSVVANYYIDCSGDSALRVCGARFRRGRESRAEFNESHAPETADDFTMGNSILMQLRQIDPAKHQPFRAPVWAYHYTDETAPKRNLDPRRPSNFWWLEVGGGQDTIGDADSLRDELMKIAYGIWEYMKNHPDGRGYEWELDWIGALPGKRENIRYVGDHILTQNDIESEGRFEDIVAYGGWSMDDHHPDGIKYPAAATIHYPAPSPYGIPYRCLYSVNIDNLLFAGRNISATHMAMSSTRVMGTAAVMGQAVGTASAVAARYGLTPREVCQNKLEELQSILQDQDAYIPWRKRRMSEFTTKAQISHEILRNGVERDLSDVDNGVWLEPGECVEYSFDSPELVSSVRLVFDSDFANRKRMPFRYPAGGNATQMPSILTRNFIIEAMVDGSWKTIYECIDNHHRLVNVSVEPLRSCCIRLRMLCAWGQGRAHVFAFELKQQE